MKRSVLVTPPSFWRMVGPSFILLGLGLGIGELILWPYLTANYGLGIIWGAVAGITMQWFINLEISRYTLATGESVFVGLTRKSGKIIPIWFIVSTIIPWMWPGITLAGARLFTVGLGWGNSEVVGVVVLLVIGSILSLGPVLYGTQEKLEKIILIFGLPFVLGISWWLATKGGMKSLAGGLFGKGEGYWFFPVGLQASAFLGAIVFSGAGGNLNLGQSQNIKEKGYGMGHGSGRITSLLTGKHEEISLTGKDFEINSDSLKIFSRWWKLTNLEQGLIFWMTGVIAMVSLSLLAYETIYHKASGLTGVDFVIAEADIIGQYTFQYAGKIFLVILGLMLFATQLSVLGTTGKILAENWAILNIKNFESSKLPKYFYRLLWGQIGLMLLVLALGFKEPFQLVLISAVLNAWTMVVYTILVLWLNTTSLQTKLRPPVWRKVVIKVIIVFLTVFGLLTLWQVFY
ncbi:MAG: hypothetical protein UW41_C0001G0038 [Candidatus Collierbacteria bacterium GW2011_GWC2_44_18]|uniref:Uncharacterized protein n=2 Tax=Microgenomates group TaxID=1794810 RepID=A0A0G1M6Y1_9BACT|nr:MAG: hypothetical protein UW16_C0009G0012 [Microgenomates group bacterium GW2011_GWC1_44_10]KKT49892.1 MAG: hypothetical protein UW41_C0001G0038 [Candidatus Collierbacteria bacterium GW2011_GWC2_44_18]KKT67659.1 MAG: hypothetical protein UW60_C0002G0011 [Candidatus Woesebacteria bacterium GW2011_GWA2_44_33]